MKRVLILHSTDGNSKENWLPWLKEKLETQGLKVWVPDLPHAEKPNISRYNNFLSRNKAWFFDENTLIIGHSSGAVAILGLLQHLPEGSKVGACVLVGSFKDDLGWESLKELFFEEFDYQLIKTRSDKFIFIHSDNDPYCPLAHAKYLSDQFVKYPFV
jgi:predicted alpha/beta hydrolase family esterase